MYSFLGFLPDFVLCLLNRETLDLPVFVVKCDFPLLCDFNVFSALEFCGDLFPLPIFDNRLTKVPLLP